MSINTMSMASTEPIRKIDVSFSNQKIFVCGWNTIKSDVMVKLPVTGRKLNHGIFLLKGDSSRVHCKNVRINRK